MIYSIYNHIFKSKKFGNLLYNAETNAFAELDDALYMQLLKIKETNDLSTLTPELIESLNKTKILVKENDKTFFYRKKFRFYFNSFNSTVLGFALAPTTFCNFNCPYCYEENRKPIFMTEEIEDQFISFIKKHETVKLVDLTWYGGEPLISFKTIQNILEKLDQEESVHLRGHSLITNGYLLDEEKSKYFSNHPLGHIQITIDGGKKFHDKRRTLSNGAPTYETIIQNIDTFFKYNKKTRISIRVNIDSSNKKAFYELHSELSEKWKEELFTVYPAFVQDYSGGNHKYLTKCELLNREDRAKFYFDLYEKCRIDLKFYPGFEIGGCGATNINYYVVGPSGELYKCWNDIGIEERIIGYLDSEKIQNYDLLCQYMAGPTMFDDEECKTCSLFPICDGGCKWMRLKNVNEGMNFDLCTSRKRHIERFLEIHYEKKKNESSNTKPVIKSNL